MKWLTDFVHMPMLWDVIIPVIALLLFALLLLWDSRLPPEKENTAEIAEKAQMSNAPVIGIFVYTALEALVCGYVHSILYLLAFIMAGIFYIYLSLGLRKTPEVM